MLLLHQSCSRPNDRQIWQCLGRCWAVSLKELDRFEGDVEPLSRCDKLANRSVYCAGQPRLLCLVSIECRSTGWIDIIFASTDEGAIGLLVAVPGQLRSALQNVRYRSQATSRFSIRGESKRFSDASWPARCCPMRLRLDEFGLSCLSRAFCCG